MNSSRGWGWLPPSDEGIWRHGLAALKPFLAAAPWITLAFVIALAALVGRRFAVQPGIVFDLPAATPAQDALSTELVALVMPLQPETGRSAENYVFFDDARYMLSDPASAEAFAAALGERAAGEPSGTLLLLADRRISSGVIMSITALARQVGVKRVEIAEKREP